MTVDDKIRHEQNENDEFGERGAQKVNHRLEHIISSRWPVPGRKIFGYIGKNLDFGAPALPVQPGSEEELLLLVKKLRLHLVPLFFKFLGIRLPPGLEG